jgi:hypothetical protein
MDGRAQEGRGVARHRVELAPQEISVAIGVEYRDALDGVGVHGPAGRAHERFSPRWFSQGFTTIGCLCEKSHGGVKFPSKSLTFEKAFCAAAYREKRGQETPRKNGLSPLIELIFQMADSRFSVRKRPGKARPRKHT